MTTKARRRRRNGAKSSGGAPRLIGYARVSSDDQARNGISLHSQRERIRAYAEASSCELVRIESDDGVSGFKAPDKRPAMARALAAVRAGDADGIVAIALDRLSRNAIETMLLIESSEREGWRLVAMDLALDTGTSTGKLVAHVLAAVAQMYRDQISERTQDALDRVAREGRARSRFTPYGWRTAKGSSRVTKGDHAALVKHPGEQKALAKMLRLRAKGEGPQGIANALNEAGMRTRNGTAWSRQAVWLLLENYDVRQEALAG
jgi:site-specific DNA recombinase